VASAGETLGILSAELFLSSPFSTQCRKNGLTLFCVPIPLFPSRERERGYNQSALIAESFAQRISLSGLSVVCKNDFLIRGKKTISQTELHSRKERQKNISGAFLAKEISLPKGSIVLLIDDVSTSGATLEEASHILRKAKVPRIAGLVVAKA
jgi:predicted amidophosphoribosyltransferase